MVPSSTDGELAMTGPAQLSYSHGASPHPLLGETIGDNLRRVAAAYPDAEAVVDVPTGRRWTYAQLDADTDTLARGLIASGIEAGERAGIWSPNCAEWVLLQYATAKAGAVLVNINPAYRSHELDYALRQSGVKHLVSAATFKTSDYRAMIEEVRGGLAELERVTYLGHRSGTRCWPPGPGLTRRRPGRARGRAAFDDPINIQYTSGTTGFPKGATLSHHNILNNGFFIGEGCRYTHADRVCIPVPFYHCFGMVLGNLACTTHGACIVIPAPASTRRRRWPRCRPSGARPCTACLPCSSPNSPCPTSPVTTCPRCGRGSWPGSPCPVEVMKRVISEMHMAEVTICYGMTETSPVSTQTQADDDTERRVSTVGRVHPHVEVKIIDPDDRAGDAARDRRASCAPAGTR